MIRIIRNINSFLLGILIVFGLAWCAEVRADNHKCYGHNCNNTGDIAISTDVDAGSTVSISGDKAFAIGQGSFDVDINECLASSAWNIVVFGRQKIEENPTCIADGLDARGNHKAAAEVRCSQVKTIYNTFPDFKQCVAAVTMPEPVQPPERAEDEGHHDAVLQLQKQLASFVEEKRKSDAVTARYVASRRVIERQDRQYAQQLIEKIQNLEAPE